MQTPPGEQQTYLSGVRNTKGSNNFSLPDLVTSGTKYNPEEDKIAMGGETLLQGGGELPNSGATIHRRQVEAVGSAQVKQPVVNQEAAVLRRIPLGTRP